MLVATDSPQYVETLLACMKLGAVYVPLNFRLARPELPTLLRTAEAKVLCYSDSGHIPPNLETRTSPGVERDLLVPAAASPG